MYSSSLKVSHGWVVRRLLGGDLFSPFWSEKFELESREKFNSRKCQRLENYSPSHLFFAWRQLVKSKVDFILCWLTNGRKIDSPVGKESSKLPQHFWFPSSGMTSLSWTLIRHNYTIPSLPAWRFSPTIRYSQLSILIAVFCTDWALLHFNFLF